MYVKVSYPCYTIPLAQNYNLYLSTNFQQLNLRHDLTQALFKNLTVTSAYNKEVCNQPSPRRRLQPVPTLSSS